MTEKDGKKRTGKKRKEVFVYGNYKYYYGYRIDRDSKEDPRLSAFKKEWFEGKDCLDVGCNQGLITVSIAKNFSCRSILGIDIDGGLIDTAYWYLWKTARKDTSCNRSMRILSCTTSEGSEQKQDTCQFSRENMPMSKFSIEDDLLKRVSFKKENFIEELDDCVEKYDTIICLSVTKWIHLNWGDEGIITLFVKLWRLLRQGGVLLLEPQPWKSYLNNRRVSEIAKENFSKILITPNLFEEILLDKIC